MARTKQGGRMSRVVSPAMPAPKKGSVEYQLAELQRTAAAKEAKLTQQLHELRASIDQDRKLQRAQFELAMQQRLKIIDETQAREQARAAEVVTPMDEAATATDSQSSASSAASASSSSSSSSSAAAAASVAAASTADSHTTRIHDLALPPHWPAAQSHHVTLETLAADHPDFLMVERMMHTTGMPSAGVLQVQRIFNRPLWDRYVHARARIMSKVGNEHLATPESMGNEKLMFHGSRHNQPHLIYANADGFDVRMAGQGMLGPGLYFSDTAGYSGTSYAHPLAPQSWGPAAGKKYTAAIPPLLQPTADGSLKAAKIPKNAYQMFLARVCLGTGFDPSKQGGRPQQGYTNRPPLRPFHCTGCKKEVDLEALNVALVRASVMRTEEKQGATLEEFDEEDGLGDTVPAAASANAGKRKRGGSAKVNKKVKTNVAAAAAAATTVGIAPAAALAAVPVASAPVVLGPQPAPIVLRKSARHAVAGAPAAVFTPPRKKIRARRSAPAAVVVAPPTPLQLAPIQQQQQQQQQQQPQQPQQPQLIVPVPQQQVAAPAVMPPVVVAAAPVAAAAAAVLPVVAAAASAPADSADDGMVTMTDAPDLEVPVAAAAAAAEESPVVSASPPAPAPLSFDSSPVCCPKCDKMLGTRGSLLAHPYRYDSVISGHMSVTYESAASYPELLITYTTTR